MTHVLALVLVGLWLPQAAAVAPRSPIVYIPESIDSLQTTTHTHVQVAGTVAAVTSRTDRALEFRLTDAHGHAVTCVLPAGASQPRVGVAIIVSGTLRLYAIVEQVGKIVELVVETIVPVED